MDLTDKGATTQTDTEAEIARLCDGLEGTLKRLRMLQMLKEWDLEDPPTEEQRQRGRDLWRAATE